MTGGTRTAATRLFNNAAGLALIVSIIAHAVQFYAEPGPGALFLCNAGILLVLAIVAIRAQNRSAGSFNSAVAAETIVAFGVLSLILGLVTAVAPLLANKGAPIEFDTATLTRLGWPFAQGLASAGLAPVIAVLVRAHGAGAVEDEDDAADETARMAAAIARLSAELSLAQQAAAGLTQSLQNATAATARIGPDIAQHLNAVVVASGQIGPEIAGSVAAIAGALDTAGAGLTNELEQAGQRAAASFDDCARQVTAFGGAAQAVAPDLVRLSGEVGKLATSAAETGELLEALNALTASVERFVAPRTAARAAP